MFFTSDTHFWHKNICLHANRPFESVEDMHEALIHNWNKTVGVRDEIYHLGDFSFGNEANTREVLNRLNGKIRLLLGNHDEIIPKVADCFESIDSYKEINHNKQKIVLCHYPLLTWNKAHRGSLMLHGHCHNNVNYLNDLTTRLDVGTDNFNYTPVHIDEAVRILSERQYGAIDHHA